MPITTVTTLTITLTITGDTASGITLQSLASDGTTAITSVTKPDGTTANIPGAAFVNAGGGAWTFSWVEAIPAANYVYGYRITWPDASTVDLAGTLLVSPAGTYATRSDMDLQIGAEQVDALSRRASDGDPDQTLIQGALNNADAWINSQLAMQNYATPARKA